MINFDEEIKKFSPSLEIGEVEDAVYHLDLTDATDMLLDLLKEQEATGESAKTDTF